MTAAGPAATFARKYRQQLFPDTPLVFAAVDRRVLGDAPLGKNETAVPVDNDFPQLIDDILQAASPDEAGVRGDGGRTPWTILASGARERVPALSQTADVRLVRQSVPCGDPASLCEPSARLGDLLSRLSAWMRRVGRMRTSGCSPSFTPPRMPRCSGRSSPMLGHGIVGGRLMSIGDHSRSAADVAAAILNGAPPGSVAVPPQRPSSEPIFDGRELRRWGIEESRLPVGSVVRNRTPGLWEEHKLTVLGSIGALALQSLLIVGLLSQRRARQRAESDSRRNLALAADASRRQTMSALTTSMAHELGQPLSSMIHNAEALQAMVDADRATSDTTREILTDIRTQGVQAAQIIERHRTMLRSHQLDRKPIDLHAVVHESLGARRSRPESAADRSRRRSVFAAVRHQRRSRAPAAGAGEPDDERGRRHGRDSAGQAVTSRSRPQSGPPTSNSRCETPERACRRKSTARCSHRSSRRNRTGSGWASRSCARSSKHMLAPSMPTTIPTGARRSRSPCRAAKPTRPGRRRRVRHELDPVSLVADDHADLVKAVCRLLAAGLRCRGNRRGRQRRAGGRATAPA